MVTAAGAGTYAATLINENGKVRNLASYQANKKYGITRVQIMGANGSHICIDRSSHEGEDLTLIQIADTLADQFKEIDFVDILAGAGVVLDENEGLSINVTVTGNATINIFVELDDKIKTVNAKAIRVEGSAAAKANELVDTGGNVPTGMNPNKTYRMRATYATSTTIHVIVYSINDSDYIFVPGKNAILTGQNYDTLSKDQAEMLTGTGSDYVQTFMAFIVATAADAANVQFLGIIFETN